MLACFAYNFVIILCVASLLDNVHTFELLAPLLRARGKVTDCVVRELQTDVLLSWRGNASTPQCYNTMHVGKLSAV